MRLHTCKELKTENMQTWMCLPHQPIESIHVLPDLCLGPFELVITDGVEQIIMIILTYQT